MNIQPSPGKSNPRKFNFHQPYILHHLPPFITLYWNPFYHKFLAIQCNYYNLKVDIKLLRELDLEYARQWTHEQSWPKSLCTDALSRPEPGG